MTLDQLLNLLPALLVCGAAIYWGGEMRANVKELCRITGDHETRIRVLEHPATKEL